MEALSAKEIVALGFNPNEYDRMYSLNSNNSVLSYKKGYYMGFISNGKVITKPIFIPFARLLSSGHIVTDYYRNVPNYNHSVVLNPTTGEDLVSGFNAYFVDGSYFAFRVNGTIVSEDRWGVFSLVEGKVIKEPTIEYKDIHKIVDSLNRY